MNKTNILLSLSILGLSTYTIMNINNIHTTLDNNQNKNFYKIREVSEHIKNFSDYFSFVKKNLDKNKNNIYYLIEKNKKNIDNNKEILNELYEFTNNEFKHVHNKIDRINKELSNIIKSIHDINSNSINKGIVQNFVEEFDEQFISLNKKIEINKIAHNKLADISKNKYFEIKNNFNKIEKKLNDFNKFNKIINDKFVMFEDKFKNIKNNKFNLIKLNNKIVDIKKEFDIVKDYNKNDILKIISSLEQIEIDINELKNKLSILEKKNKYNYITNNKQNTKITK